MRSDSQKNVGASSRAAMKAQRDGDEESSEDDDTEFDLPRHYEVQRMREVSTRAQLLLDNAPYLLRGKTGKLDMQKRLHLFAATSKVSRQIGRDRHANNYVTALDIKSKDYSATEEDWNKLIDIVGKNSVINNMSRIHGIMLFNKTKIDRNLDYILESNDLLITDNAEGLRLNASSELSWILNDIRKEAMFLSVQNLMMEIFCDIVIDLLGEVKTWSRFAKIYEFYENIPEAIRNESKNKWFIAFRNVRYDTFDTMPELKEALAAAHSDIVESEEPTNPRSAYDFIRKYTESKDPSRVVDELNQAMHRYYAQHGSTASGFGGWYLPSRFRIVELDGSKTLRDAIGLKHIRRGREAQ